MDLTFKCEITATPEFLDFLLVLLKPNELVPPLGYSENFGIRGASLISIEELERKLKEWARKHQKEYYVGLKVERIILTNKEKKEIGKSVFFEKVGN